MNTQFNQVITQLTSTSRITRLFNLLSVGLKVICNFLIRDLSLHYKELNDLGFYNNISIET